MLEEVVNPAQVDAFRLEEMYSLGSAASDSSIKCYVEMKHRLGPNKNCSVTQEYEPHVARKNDMFTSRKIQKGTPVSEPESTFRQLE
jgi:hypothetical protein